MKQWQDRIATDNKMLLKRRKRSGEQARGTGKWKMGRKPNLNFSPTSNFISNSLFCSHFSLSCSHDSFPAPRFNGASRARASGAPYLKENGNLSGYDVSVRPYVRTDFGGGSGGGTGGTGNY